MLPEHLPDINLLPYSDRRKSSMLYHIFLVILGLILLLSAVMIFLYFKTNHDLKNSQEEVAQLEQQQLALNTKLNAANAAQKDPYANAVKFTDERQLQASTLLTGLKKPLPENSYLSNFNYNLGEVEITTEFETLQETSKYLEDLHKLDYVKSARIENVESFEVKDSETEEDLKLMLDRATYNILPRYRVRYTFTLDPVELEKAKEAEKEAGQNE